MTSTSFWIARLLSENKNQMNSKACDRRHILRVLSVGVWILVAEEKAERIADRRRRHELGYAGVFWRRRS